MRRRRDDDLVVLALGVLMLAVSRRRDVIVPPTAWGAGWVWPVPTLITESSEIHLFPARYDAVITQEFRNPSHLGVDVAYRRLAANDRPEMKPPHDSLAQFFAPAATPVVAARAGRIWSVDRSPRGWEIVVDHGKPFATYYQHLASTPIPPHADGKPLAGGDAWTVKAGDPLGVMGYDPTDPQGFRHLHFAVWYQGAGNDASADPASAMRTWARTSWVMDSSGNRTA